MSAFDYEPPAPPEATVRIYRPLPAQLHPDDEAMQVGGWASAEVVVQYVHGKMQLASNRARWSAVYADGEYWTDDTWETDFTAADLTDGELSRAEMELS